MNSDTQVNLRLPLVLKERLHAEARNNNRSLNLELNERLQRSLVSVEDSYTQILDKLSELMLRHHSSARTQEIRSRLEFLLQQFLKLPFVPHVTVARIAYELGFERADEVQQWFLGRLEPTFGQLKQLAHYFGCHSDWLCFGMGSAFTVQHMSASRLNSAESLIEFCFTPLEGFTDTPTVKFIRNLSRNGEVLIVKQQDHIHAQVYTTTLHLSDVVGATGAAAQRVLVSALKQINHSQHKLAITGYLIDADTYAELIAGSTHPLLILSRQSISYWVDDIWDKHMYLKQAEDEYWQGWRALCVGIGMGDKW